MSRVVGHPEDAKFRRDLELVARGLPGRGAALDRIIELAHVTQQDLADKLGCDRSAISHWIRDTRWPAPRVVVDLLIALNVDRSLVAEASSILLGTDVLGEMGEEVFRASNPLHTFNVTKEELIEVLKMADSDTQLDLIYEALTTPVILALGLKGAGQKGGEACDVKAAKEFLEQREKHKAAKAALVSAPPRPVGESSTQAEWTKGSLNAADRAKDEKPGPEDPT